jgi:hypothetical protein
MGIVDADAAVVDFCGWVGLGNVVACLAMIIWQKFTAIQKTASASAGSRSRPWHSW